MKLELEPTGVSYIKCLIDTVKCGVGDKTESLPGGVYDVECFVKQVRAKIFMLKFVVVEKDCDRFVRVFVPWEKSHSEVVDGWGAGEIPVGGGFIGQPRFNPDLRVPVGGGVKGDDEKESVWWNSGSFLSKFGFDRPADQQTADELLAEVSRLFDEWLRGMLG